MDSQLVSVDRGEQCGTLTGELVEQRIQQNYHAITNSLAVSELRLLLVQERLLTALEAERFTPDATSLLRNVREKAQQIGPEAYITLYRCISQLQHQLGHRYVKSLIEGKEYATQEEMKRADMIKQRVLDNLSKFVDCDISALIPLMVSRELLTFDEGQHLSTARLDKYTLPLQLVNLLGTKGPLAYSLFAECLRQETRHITHRELHELINQPMSTRKRHCWDVEVSCVGGPSRRRPLPSHKLRSCLRGRCYNELMRRFQSCHHNGKWTELEDEAAKLARDSPRELQVVGLLERAVSWIFRKECAKVLQLVGEAKITLAKMTVGDNHQLLQGRCEYILSRLYRYLKDYEKAQEHVEKASYHLRYAEPGEDSAFVHYCDACIKVERLSESSTALEVKDAEMRYEYAIDHARRHDSGLDLVAPHSFMRLAQMYLGSSHYAAGSKHDPESIQKASNCLRQVAVSSLAQRSKCHFYLIESDLHRSQGSNVEAIKSAKLALGVAKEHNFTLEVHSAGDRLRTLMNPPELGSD